MVLAQSELIQPLSSYWSRAYKGWNQKTVHYDDDVLKIYSLKNIKEVLYEISKNKEIQH